MEIVYVGPHDAVEVELGDGSFVVCARHVPTLFDPEVARSLLQQPTNWQRAPKRAEKTTANAKE